MRLLIFSIDVAVIAIVAFCCWRGYKNGLIRGVFGIVTIIASLFLASIAATAYSDEFTEMLKPFVGGIVDSALMGGRGGDEDVEDEADADSAGDKDEAENEEDEEEAEDEEEYDLSAYEDESEDFISAYTALRRIGLPDSSAARIAGNATEDLEGERTPAGFLSVYISDKLSSALAFAAVFGIAFVLLAIVFTVVGNLIGFVFSLPGLKLVDNIAGAVFGAVKGLLLVLALAAVMRYIGLLMPETIGKTAILKYFINNNFLANWVGL